jgi:hypothetical protein
MSQPGADTRTFAERQAARDAYWADLAEKRQRRLAGLPAGLADEIVAAEKRMAEAVVARRREDLEPAEPQPQPESDPDSVPVTVESVIKPPDLPEHPIPGVDTCRACGSEIRTARSFAGRCVDCATPEALAFARQTGRKP